MREVIILSASGIVAGFVNGFFGTGGGLIAFYTLVLIGCDTRRALATANFIILALSLFSFALYIKAGTLSADSVRAFFKVDLLPALIGGGVGAYLSGKISPRLLKKIFSALVILCGIKGVMG